MVDLIKTTGMGLTRAAILLLSHDSKVAGIFFGFDMPANVPHETNKWRSLGIHPRQRLETLPYDKAKDAGSSPRSFQSKPR